jgi:dihydroxyacetone kinase-like protein
MNARALVALLAEALLAEALPALARHENELRDLDAALGDGDLGITVRSGSNAVVAAVAALPDGVTLDMVVSVTGKAFASANPSTFAALVGGGLLAGSKALAGVESMDRVQALRFARVATDRIAERGKAQLGDKTVLDALLPSLDVLESATEDARGAEIVTAMAVVARERVAETAGLQSARGRAAWVGERGVGHPDPGATAYAIFLECLAEALAASDG